MQYQRESSTRRSADHHNGYTNAQSSSSSIRSADSDYSRSAASAPHQCGRSFVRRSDDFSNRNHNNTSARDNGSRAAECSYRSRSRPRQQMSSPPPPPQPPKREKCREPECRNRGQMMPLEQMAVCNECCIGAFGRKQYICLSCAISAHGGHEGLELCADLVAAEASKKWTEDLHDIDQRLSAVLGPSAHQAPAASDRRGKQIAVGKFAKEFEDAMDEEFSRLKGLLEEAIGAEIPEEQLAEAEQQVDDAGREEGELDEEEPEQVAEESAEAQAQCQIEQNIGRRNCNESGASSSSDMDIDDDNNGQLCIIQPNQQDGEQWADEDVQLAAQNVGPQEEEEFPGEDAPGQQNCDIAPSSSATEGASQPLAVRVYWRDNVRRRDPCVYFEQGYCRNGDKCAFLHFDARKYNTPAAAAKTAGNGN